MFLLMEYLCYSRYLELYYINLLDMSISTHVPLIFKEISIKEVLRKYNNFMQYFDNYYFIYNHTCLKTSFMVAY